MVCVNHHPDSILSLSTEHPVRVNPCQLLFIFKPFLPDITLLTLKQKCCWGKNDNTLLLVEFSYLGQWLLQSPETWLDEVILGSEVLKIGGLFLLSANKKKVKYPQNNSPLLLDCYL